MGDHGEVWGDVPPHRSSLMWDDVAASLADLRAGGVDVADEIIDE